MNKIKSFLFKISLKYIAKYIFYYDEQLKPFHLQYRGWVAEESEDGKILCHQPDIKDRDKVWVEFERHYYRVWHGPNKPS